VTARTFSTKKGRSGGSLQTGLRVLDNVFRHNSLWFLSIIPTLPKMKNFAVVRSGIINSGRRHLEGCQHRKRSWTYLNLRPCYCACGPSTVEGSGKTISKDDIAAAAPYSLVLTYGWTGCVDIGLSELNRIQTGLLSPDPMATTDAETYAVEGDQGDA